MWRIDHFKHDIFSCDKGLASYKWSLLFLYCMRIFPKIYLHINDLLCGESKWFAALMVNDVLLHSAHSCRGVLSCPTPSVCPFVRSSQTHQKHRNQRIADLPKYLEYHSFQGQNATHKVTIESSWWLLMARCLFWHRTICNNHDDVGRSVHLRGAPTHCYTSYNIRGFQASIFCADID